MDIYPFFGFFEADFIGDTEGIVILILPPVWHLKSIFQMKIMSHTQIRSQDQQFNWDVVKRFHLHSPL